jgi:flagellar basal body-associated protein FliL
MVFFDVLEDLSLIPFVGIIACLVIIFILCGKIIAGRNLQAKIDMYTEENQKIEQDISVMVNQYMEFEGNVIDDVSGENAITLVNLYPDLKSSELVKQEISIHTENNAKIKELKEKQIDIRTYKWWLYFGGK